MSHPEPKTYRVEIRTMGGSTLGDAEPTWTIFQFDVALSEVPALVASALQVDDTADMEITDDFAQPPVWLWRGDAAKFCIRELATA
jgi:hypothetical protein